MCCTEEEDGDVRETQQNYILTPNFMLFWFKHKGTFVQL